MHLDGHVGSNDGVLFKFNCSIVQIPAIMKAYIRVIILFISITTVLSGIMQLVAPAFVLNLIGADVTGLTKQLFATIAMFMILFGGLVIQSLYNAQANRTAFFWGALQKLCASVAVFIGILHHLFLPRAAIVASFDLISGIIFFYYLMTTKNDNYENY